MASFEYRNSIPFWDAFTQTACIGVSTVCVGMRMCSKFVLMSMSGWDDYTCLLAWVGLVGYAVISFEADKHGSGVHQQQVAETDLAEYSKLAYISQIVYGPLIFITKLSILLLYLRIFSPTLKSKAFLLIQFLIWGNLAFYLTGTLIKIFQCMPRKKVWDQSISGQCVQIEVPIMVTSTINAISNFSILLLPLVCGRQLQMKMKMDNRLGVSLMFLVGLFGCACSIGRLIVSVQNLATDDKTYVKFPEFLWTTGEVTSGIVTSCLPAIPIFLRHFHQKVVAIFPRRGAWDRGIAEAGMELKPCSSNPRRDGTQFSAADPYETTGSEQDGFECSCIKALSGKGWVETTVSAEVVGPIQGGRPNMQESQLLPAEGGILKTVEIEVVYETRTPNYN